VISSSHQLKFGAANLLQDKSPFQPKRKNTVAKPSNLAERRHKKIEDDAFLTSQLISLFKD